jgi:hypothetical protein
MHDEAPDIRHESRPLALAGILVSGVLGSAFLGGTTNAVNGAVSPDYFVRILGWHGVEDVWRASIAQGIFEGIMFGIFLSFLFTVVTGVLTSASCSYGFAARHLLGILAGAYGCWAVGGLAAVGLAALSPEFYRRAFIGVPEGFEDMLRYAWVGGSIWGAEFGGFVSVIVGLVILRANWRRRFDRTEVESTDIPELPTGQVPSDHHIKPA